MSVSSGRDIIAQFYTSRLVENLMLRLMADFFNELEGALWYIGFDRKCKEDVMLDKYPLLNIHVPDIRSFITLYIYIDSFV